MSDGKQDSKFPKSLTVIDKNGRRVTDGMAMYRAMHNVSQRSDYSLDTILTKELPSGKKLKYEPSNTTRPG